MRSISFEGDTWNIIKNLEQRIKHYIGQSELLRYGLSGLWSRRLSKKDRLIYRFDEERIYLFAIGEHYD